MSHRDSNPGPQEEICINVSYIIIVTVKIAKSEWKKLRDNHRDSLKRQKSGKTGQAATNTNKWKYAEIMEFLLPYMKNRERSTNMTSTEDTSSNSDLVNTSTLDTKAQDVENELTVPELDTATPAPQASNTRKRKNDNDDEVIKIKREMRSSRQEEINNKQKRKRHPIEIFFDSMAQSTKSMPSYLQNRIKTKVLQIVCEAEEEYEESFLQLD